MTNAEYAAARDAMFNDPRPIVDAVFYTSASGARVTGWRYEGGANERVPYKRVKALRPDGLTETYSDMDKAIRRSEACYTAAARGVPSPWAREFD